MINIHTNVEEHMIEEALNKTTYPCTKAFVKLAGIKFSHITHPTHTKSGSVIDKLPNQPEFVRTVIPGTLGGSYLDEDFYIFLDLEPLRSTGFEDIVGQHPNDHIYISNSLFLKLGIILGRKIYVRSKRPHCLLFGLIKCVANSTFVYNKAKR